MITPLGHRLLIKPEKLEDVDKVYSDAKQAGLYVPDQTARQEQVAIDKGTVVSLGATAFRAFDDGVPWCAVGDLVAYTRYGGKLLKDPETEQEYIVLNDEDVIAKYGTKEIK